MSHRKQFIWKRSVELCVICYRLTKHFPQSELYGLTNQIRRAAVSVPSNMVSTLQKLSK
ncbi:four helix bundle protein [Myxosarcina sp. GI1(2024)]